MKYTVLLLASLSLLAACGVKPKEVSGAEGHPREYPDLKTDPLPHGGPGATIAR